MTRIQPLSFDLISIVWGESYVKVFLELIIPSYLSQNNIPFSSKKYPIVSNIYTTVNDAKTIASHAHFKKMNEFINCEIIPNIDNSLLNSTNKYGAKGYCQSLAIKKAIKNRSVVLLLNPDSLISDGSLLKCCNLIEDGKKAVIVSELARIETESILPKLKPYFDRQSLSLTLPSRQLVELGIKHLHEIGKHFFWHGEHFTNWPSIVYWRAGEKSILAKYFHLHPLAIDLRETNVNLPEILMPDDGGLIEFLGLPPDLIHTNTDSNEIVSVELSSKNMDPLGVHRLPSKMKQTSLLKFSLKCALPSHMDNFLKFNLRFQADEEVDWNETEKNVSKDLKSIRPILHVIRWMNSVMDMFYKQFRFLAIKLGARYVKRKIMSYCDRKS
ncbi:MAG TPA: hypothetical protein VLE96_00095 [Chlamydiales bacterium]|nr:hypothetical protein [Chlamydiales bacterium]